jgi:hydroxymethylbilane synthase
MAQTSIRIGTRESQLAVWQATLVKDLLKQNGISSELVYIKSEGDIDLVTPLYDLGVQGIFTKTLDAALLNNRIDIAVHSMKDVPTKLALGIKQASVLKRASYKDILVYKNKSDLHRLGFENGVWGVVGKIMQDLNSPFTIATSSIRRMAQWLHRYPHHKIENLRGNVNTRMRKFGESSWNGAIFAGAGLERIDLRPENSVDLDWMLPAPSQGAIMVVCRKDDQMSFNACQSFNDNATAICTKIEKDFLRVLMGGCSTPISALAELTDGKILFRGNLCSVNGEHKIDVIKEVQISESENLGTSAANELLQNTKATQILAEIRNAKN